MKKLYLSVLALASVMAVSAAKFVKVTSAPKAWDGEYILVYDVPETDSVCVFSGVDAIDGYVGAKADTAKGVISGNFVTISIISGKSGDSIKVNGGNNDGKYISKSSTAKNELMFDDASKVALMTITYESEAWVKIANSDGSVMRYNKSSNQGNRFRMYKSNSYTNQQPVQLYKLEETPTFVETVAEKANFIKTIENNQVVIIRNGVHYNVAGQIIK